MSGTFINSEY